MVKRKRSKEVIDFQGSRSFINNCNTQVLKVPLVQSFKSDNPKSGLKESNQNAFPNHP
jgi:hypothetical protein